MNQYECIKYLEKVLLKANERIKGLDNFEGIGVAIYDLACLDDLPVVPLRDTQAATKENLPISNINEIVSSLIKYSRTESPFHDGFSLISKTGQLTHISQYFSPPIKKYLILDYLYGGRYRAAQYGSCIPGVIACGVLSKNYGPTFFVKGSTYVVNSKPDTQKDGWSEIYSKKTILYDYLSRAQDRQDLIWKDIANDVDYESNTIEVGPGTGKYTFRLSKLAKNVLGIEKNASMYNYLNTQIDLTKTPNVRTELGDFLKHQIADHSDVYSFWGLSNPWNDDYSSYNNLMAKIKEMKDVRLFFVTSAPGIIGSTQGKNVLSKTLIEVHRRKKNHFLRLLELSGFKMQVVETTWKFDSYEEASEIFSLFFGHPYRQYISCNRLQELESKDIVLKYKDH